MKKMSAGLIALALATGGSLAVAGPASAHTPAVTADCLGVNVNLTNYATDPGKPAVTKTVVVTPAVPAVPAVTKQELVSEATPLIPAVYKTVVVTPAKPAVPETYKTVVVTPAIPATPAVPAVTKTEVEFKWWGAKDHGVKQWTSGAAPAQRLNDVKYAWYEGGGYGYWQATGQTRVITVTPAVPAKPAVPAVTKQVVDQPGIPAQAEVTAQELVTAEVPAKEAVYKTVVVTPEIPAKAEVTREEVVTPAVAANDKPNKVQIRVGDKTDTYYFGTTFTKTVDIADYTKATSYAVNVVAFDDPAKNQGWTKYFTGTTTGCVSHVQDYVKCEGAAFVLDNTGVGREVVYDVNGIKFVVGANKAVHTDSDGKLIEPNKNGQYVISTPFKTWTFDKKDCSVPPVVTTPPTDEPTTPPTTPPTDEPTDAPTPPKADEPKGEPTAAVVAASNNKATPAAKAAKVEAQDDSLAFTGSDGALGWGIGALVTLALGLALTRFRKRATISNK